MLVVAVGAGMYAGIKERQQAVRDVLLTDICPFTLGTEIIHGDPKGPAIMFRSLSGIRFFRSAGWSDTGRYISSRNTVISRFYRASTAMQTRIWSSDGSSVPVPLARREDQREAVDVRFTGDINGILKWM